MLYLCHLLHYLLCSSLANHIPHLFAVHDRQRILGGYNSGALCSDRSHHAGKAPSRSRGDNCMSEPQWSSQQSMERQAGAIGARGLAIRTSLPQIVITKKSIERMELDGSAPILREPMDINKGWEYCRNRCTSNAHLIRSSEVSKFRSYPQNRPSPLWGKIKRREQGWRNP